MEKKTLLELTEGLNQWQTKPLFNLPSLSFADGPHGLRKQIVTDDPFGSSSSHVATCFPTASITACSFDKNLLYNMASKIAKEARTLNVHVLLGPGVNIKRSPLCGRNFEYFSEDPLLSGILGASFVKGLQDNGIGASVKHFFGNNQELYRYTINSVIDKRALREIYLKPFSLVVKENPATIMTSYNKVNGIYTNEHPILKDIVREEWNYNGVLISDWGAVNNKLNTIKASHDLEMPSSRGFFNSQIENDLDDEIIKSLYKTKERIENLVNTYAKKYDEKVDFDAQHETARHIARESMVLLKNENVLPLNKDENVLITGPFTFHMRYQGSGSSLINPYKVDTIKDKAHEFSKNVTVTKGINFNSDDVDSETINLASSSSKVILLIGLPDEYETEGFDRTNINIPSNQIKLIEEIYKVNKNIILVLVGGSVMDLSFDNMAKGVLLAGLGGGASASAILDILYGYSPSGRLSETYLHKLEDSNVQLTNNNSSVYYNESIYVGYRYYDTFDISVKYPFGFGLSYSSFEYSNLTTSISSNHLNISFKLKNIGKVNAKEVIQIYIGAPKTSVYKPKKELRYFDKISLNVNEEKEVNVKINLDDLKYYDIYKNKFILEDGSYTVYVSKDVSNHLLKESIYIKGEKVNHEKTSYLNDTYDTSDFNKIYLSKLPKESIKVKRPYTLNSTLNDFKNTFLGRIIRRFIIRTALKEIKSLSEDMQNLTKKMLDTTPLRVLAVYGGDAFKMEMALKIIDVVNLKFIKKRKIKK